MNGFMYVSTEGVLLDDTDTIDYVKWKIRELKMEGYSDENIENFILSDDCLLGNSEQLLKFIVEILCSK